MGEDLIWPAHVSLNDGGALDARQKHFTVRDYDRVIIYVDHPVVRRDLVSDRVHIPLGGQSRPDVEKLAYTGFGEEADGTAQERAILLGHERCVWDKSTKLVDQFT